MPGSDEPPCPGTAQTIGGQDLADATRLQAARDALLECDR